jgi:hypothetical protein
MTIIIVCCCVGIMLSFIACYYINEKSRKHKLSPYARWTEYYSNRSNPPQQQKQTQTIANNGLEQNEIHHFYSKHREPAAFTPYLAKRDSPSSINRSSVNLYRGSFKDTYNNEIRETIRPQHTIVTPHRPSVQTIL